MFVVRNPTPRLILLRIAPPFSTDDADEVAKKVRAIFEKNQPRTTAVFVDVRDQLSFSPEIEEAMISLMVADNPLLWCSGLLYSNTGTLNRQAVTILRATGNPLRFASTVRPQLMAWLEARLEREMINEIESFLAEADLPT